VAMSGGAGNAAGSRRAGDCDSGEPGAEDTDEWALAHGYVSIVPVQVDLTDYRQLAALANVLE